MTELPTVKCQDCGFLTAVTDTGRVEVTRNQRTTGERPSAGVQYAPVCNVDAHPISTEYAPSPDQTPAGGERGRRYLAVITAARVCGKFVPHQPGRSPEQHRERAEAESDAERDHMREFEILKWQADEASKAHYRQVERDEAQRKWHEDFAAKQAEDKRKDDESQRKWQEEQDKKRQDAENARHRSTRRQEVLMWLVGGAVIGLAALIGYFGDRHFAELDKQREKDAKTVPTAKAE